jgi:Zn-dependent protease/predicted transcriptional regulator
MIRQSIRLTRIRGIEIGVHYSWFIVLVLITLSLTTLFAEEHPQWPRFEHYAMGAAASLLFFTSILLHELAHSFVALAKRIPVRSITLFVFGGIAQITREPDRPLTEFQIAIVGPIASMGLALGFKLVAMAAAGWSDHAQAVADWLAHVNLVLAIFNLLPGFPLDGGRVFRAVVWRVTGSYTRATAVAAKSGQIMGYMFILGGILIGFTANWFNGLWLAFIGWFLLIMAQESVLQATLRSALKGLTAKDIMASDCPTVSGRMSLAELVDDHMLRTGQRCFLVAEDGNVEGLVTLHQVKTVPRENWAVIPVNRAMIPYDRLRVVHPDTPIFEVLEAMDRADVNQVPVTKAGRLVGMITRDHLLQIIRARMELENQAA